MNARPALLLIIGHLLSVPCFATDWNSCRALGLTSIDECMRYDDDPAFRAEVTRAQGQDREKARPPTPQTVIIRGCDGGGCWDDQGNEYRRTGGNTFSGPAGPCRQVGSMMQCP